MKNSPYIFDNFFHLKDEFSLGHLTTESFHPLSRNLSSLSKNDLFHGFKVLQEIDELALERLSEYKKEIYLLSHKIKDTLLNQKKIYLVGCGATGRLSLSIETYARRYLKRSDVIGFMAGGDYALIKSVERFEDNDEYGKRQLHDVGFEEGDFLIAITEGGETNFVIGACLEAEKISTVRPHFIYCNPRDELIRFERCRKVLTHERIDTLELVVGPMALSGSTRMQATTVQMLSVLFALMYHDESEENFYKKMDRDIRDLKNISYNILESLTIKEASSYERGELVTYQTNKELAVAILTDTTERSPTFSLKSFEKCDEDELGPIFMVINDTKNSREAWESLLEREPRGLNFKDLPYPLDLNEIYKFDISINHLERRSNSNRSHSVFKIDSDGDQLTFNFKGEEVNFDFSYMNMVIRQVALKLLLNAHSTLLMGRLGRYESNVMTWVRPSNFKLIDRATRYVLYLAEQKGRSLSYNDVASKIIEYSKTSSMESEAIVLKVLGLFF